ncbi:MAG: NUDIX domain-containing protein [Minisyncoccia bacterium]
MLDFTGAKIALLFGDQVVMILRDDIPGLVFANMWDFPGGGKEESDKNPIECALREVEEELGIKLDPNSVFYKKEHPSMRDPNATAYFMAAKITKETFDSIKLGNEGQRWELMSISDVMSRDDVVPYLKGRFQGYLDSLSISSPKEDLK